MAFGQEAHILFNRVNMGVYNPAFTGTQGTYVSFNSRSQWTSIEDAPRTNYLIYQMPQKKNVNLGFTLQNDKVFIENKTFLTIDYNYQLKLSEQQTLYLGIKGGGFYNDINTSKLRRLTTLENPFLAPVRSYFTPILGVGAQLKGPNYFLGIGVPSLFNNKRFQDDGGIMTTATDRPYVHASGGASFKMTKDIRLEPVAVYRAIPDNPNLFSATFALNYKNKFNLGGGFASNDNIAFFLTSSSIKGMVWGYGYEFMNRNDPTAVQGGSHEFMLRFNFKSVPVETTRKEGYGQRN